MCPGEPAVDVQALRDRADRGHADSAVKLAKLMLEGRWLESDFEQLLGWIRIARGARHPEAIALDSLLEPTSRISVEAALRTWLDRRPRPRVVLREAPLLAYVDGGLSAAACAWLRDGARARLQPALVYNPTSGKSLQDSSRSNSAANLGELDLNTVLIEWRLLAQVQAAARLARSEHVSVLHYAVGQQYLAHRDYLNPTSQPDQFPPHGPGQRTRTAFAYLNDVEAGGETSFPTLGVSITPKLGRLVLFDNLDGSGKPDPSTLHAALPVVAGEKWLATLWLREHWVR